MRLLRWAGAGFHLEKGVWRVERAFRPLEASVRHLENRSRPLEDGPLPLKNSPDPWRNSFPRVEAPSAMITPRFRRESERCAQSRRPAKSGAPDIEMYTSDRQLAR